jgi:hypothetical protein
MTDVDALVNTWAFEKFVEESRGSWKDDNEWWHLRDCKEVEIVRCEHDWHCGCYSEYTRDDTWEIAIHMECPHLGLKSWLLNRWSWGDLPEIIAELRERDAKAFECSVDGHDYEP